MPENNISGQIVNIIDKISRISAGIAIFFLLGMVVLIVLDVFLRFAFRSPILGSVELVEYFMVIGGFLAIAWCARNGGHVFVGIIVDRLPLRIQAIFDSITLLLGTALVPLVIWRNFAQAIYAHSAKTTSTILRIPDYPFYFVVGIGYSILFLVLIILLIENIKKVVRNES